MSYYFIEKASPKGNALPVHFMKKHRSSEPGESAFKLHNHDVLEISAVTRGNVTFLLDGKAYSLSAGDVSVCNPYVLHEGRWQSVSDSEYLTLTLSLPMLMRFDGNGLAERLSDLLAVKSCFNELIPHESPSSPLLCRQLELGYLADQKKTPAGDLEALSCAYAILALLLDKHLSPVSEEQKHKNDKTFFKSVTAYLEENYRRNIGTSDIASALYMTKSQFCHTFRKYYGDTFSNHLCKYRIARATEISGNSEKTLAEIAADVGFSSYRYFARAFKQHIGCSPSVYFKRRR